jgi:hypothetical protein
MAKLDQIEEIATELDVAVHVGLGQPDQQISHNAPGDCRALDAQRKARLAAPIIDVLTIPVLKRKGGPVYLP